MGAADASSVTGCGATEADARLGAAGAVAADCPVESGAAESCGSTGWGAAGAMGTSAGIGTSEAVCTGAVRNEMVFTKSGRIGSFDPAAAIEWGSAAAV